MNVLLLISRGMAGAALEDGDAAILFLPASSDSYLVRFCLLLFIVMLSVGHQDLESACNPCDPAPKLILIDD